MSVLDNIVRKVFFEGPETVSSNWDSPSFSIDNTEYGFSVEFKYDSGNSVDMKVYLAFSNDNVNFAVDTESELIITDSSGVLLFDVLNSSLLYCRVFIEVTGGDISVLQGTLAGKRRH
jgi:hypothetical protein